jgi:SAM-dependent methyltransferase
MVEFTPLDKRWDSPFDFLREKWHEVPAGATRLSSRTFDECSDEEVRNAWTTIQESVSKEFDVRGWYHLLYKDILHGKKVLDVGSGLGIDGIYFALHGAHVTFLDICEANLAFITRIGTLLELERVDTFFMNDVDSLYQLPTDFDVIWCQGSLMGAPFTILHREVQALLQHLPPGGRWIELAYPRIRWEREGRLPFHQWGEKTDGGAPWMEWYDLEKLKKLLEPAEFDVVLAFDFHDHDFNWFDLVRRK